MQDASQDLSDEVKALLLRAGLSNLDRVAEKFRHHELFGMEALQDGFPTSFPRSTAWPSSRETRPVVWKIEKVTSKSLPSKNILLISHCYSSVLLFSLRDDHNRANNGLPG